MSKTVSKTVTINGIPEDLWKNIKSTAKKNGYFLSKMVVVLLERGLESITSPENQG